MVIGEGRHADVIRSFYTQNGSIVGIGDNRKRKEIAEAINQGYWSSIAVHRSAIIMEGAFIDVGSVIMPNAVIGLGAKIGKHVIINTGATVDHDCVIGDYAHIAPGAHLCGHVEVGEGALVGVGVGIAPMCKVPPWTLVKARRLEMEPLYG